MVIQCDTRQKMNQKHHEAKERWFVEHGYDLLRSKLAFGDYAFPNDMSKTVDTKKDCNELYQDLIQDHKRFHNECESAKACGIKLYVLVENKDGFTKPEDILGWKNPQYFRYLRDKKKGIERKPPASNLQLVKIMRSMSRDYGVEFLFCSTEEAAPMIVKLLGGEP